MNTKLEMKATIPTMANEKKGTESINKLCGQTLFTTTLATMYNQTMKELTHKVKDNAFLALIVNPLPNFSCVK